MRLCTCEHPKYVLNKYTGERIAANCGKCPSCMNFRAKKWINNLDVECKQHKYCYMVTLTYDDDHLPKLMYTEDSLDYIEFVNRPSERIPIKELYELCYDEHNHIIDRDIDYLHSRLAHPLGLPCVYSKDFSDFFKRLNKITFTHYTHTYGNYRYFLCHEYGPSTHRPHAHMLVWFDSDIICRNFQKILHKAWTFGNCESDSVFSDGGKNYVAQYVNSLCHLPSFYKHKVLRQRIQFSKSPAIGSYNLLDEEVRGIYDRIPCKRSVFSPSSGKYVIIPIQSSIKSRFFPKLVGYNNFSHSVRVALYGCCSQIPSEGFAEFQTSVQDCLWLRSRQISNRVETFVADYYDYLENQVLNTSPDISPDAIKETLDNSLYRWYGISRRICTFAYSLGVDVNYIVSRIEEFYKNEEYENLVDFYSWCESYTKVHSVRDLVCAYPQFYYDVGFAIKEGKFGSLPFSYEAALFSFDIVEEEDFPKLEESFDFRTMKISSEKIYKDTHKSHDIRRYQYSRRFHESDPKLQSIILNYNYGKKYYAGFEYHP